MKLATILSLALLVLGLGIFQDLQAQTMARYETQFVEVSSSGSFLDVKVQIRSAGVDFQLYNANLVFTFSPVSSLGLPSMLKRFENFDNTTSSHYAAMTLTNPTAGRVSLNIIHNDAPYTVVSSSWMDVAVVRFPVTNSTGAYSLAWRMPTSTNALPAGSTLVYQYADGKSSLIPGAGLNDLKGSLNPLDLLAFTARVSGKEVLLNWATGPNAQVSRFDVERSSNGSATANASVWKAIGTVDGAAKSNSTAGKTYSFTDKDASGATMLYYRLKMTDANGQSKYSAVVKVQMVAANAKPQLLASYPNPFNPTTTVHFTIPEEALVTVAIFDAAGKEVTRLYDNELLQAGDYSKVFNASELASGKYLLRLVAGDYIATENLVLNK